MKSHPLGAVGLDKRGVKIDKGGGAALRGSGLSFLRQPTVGCPETEPQIAHEVSAPDFRFLCREADRSGKKRTRDGLVLPAWDLPGQPQWPPFRRRDGYGLERRAMDIR